MTKLKIWNYDDPALPPNLQLIKWFFLRPEPPRNIRTDYTQSSIHLRLTARGISCICPPCFRRRLAGQSNSSAGGEG